MTCEACARAATAAIRALDPAAKIAADPPSRTVTVESSLSEPAIRAVLAAAGFAPS
ncbi:MAG TPA: cation transporter [Steroidobacteraceae bacterium]|nr:cation transporter [Steroidobacteraceae bacterium]